MRPEFTSIAFARFSPCVEFPAGLRMHDLRHRCGTDLLARGADVVKVQAMLGHSDVRTTMRYCHLSREHLRGLPGMVERPAGATMARGVANCRRTLANVPGRLQVLWPNGPQKASAR